MLFLLSFTFISCKTYKNSEVNSIGIIGSADGPTAIYIKVNPNFLIQKSLDIVFLGQLDFWDPDILNRICSRIGVTGVFNRSEGQYIVSANVSSDSLEVYVDDETVTFKEISGEC